MSTPTPKDISELSPHVIAYTNGQVLLAQTGSFFAVALLTVLLRSYSRRFIVKSFGKDDWTMLFAMACATVCFASYAYQVSLGVGKYVAVVQANQASYRQILKARQVHMIAVVIGISVAKISVAFLLLRLTIKRLYSYFLCGVIIFLTCFTIACTCTLIFQCIPIQAAWDTRLQPPPFGTGNAKCFSGNAFSQIGLFNGIVNIVTDFLLALLPIPLIWTLHMNVLSRISLIVILGLGVFAAIAGIMRQASMTSTFTDSEPWVHDTYAIWNFIELDMGIIAASLPATKPLLSRFYDTARSLTGGTKASGFNSNIANVCIRQPHPSETEGFDMTPYKSDHSIRISAQPDGVASQGLWCANKRARSSSEDSILPRTDCAGKGAILVTQHVEVNKS